MKINDIMVALNCELRRRRIRRAIKSNGGRISGNVKTTVGVDGYFTFGKSLYFNGGGITASERMQIVVVGGQINIW